LTAHGASDRSQQEGYNLSVPTGAERPRFRRPRILRSLTLLTAVIGLTAVGVGCGGGSGDDADQKIVIYSGREEEIVAPLLTQFTETTGIEVDVRYGKSSELAAQIAEEGANAPADVFFSQDAGALGSVSDQLAAIPQASLDRVEAGFRDPAGKWVGTSGRVRVVAFNPQKYTAEELPDDVLEYAKPEYAKHLGIAPTNASFQAFVTAMRMKHGDATTKKFLQDLKANGAKTFEGNRPIVEAIADGDVDLGLVNHYYLALVKAERPDATVENKFLAAGDPGALVNVAGVGILASGKNTDGAQKFVEFLLSDDGQKFYGTEAEENEYPLVAGIPPQEGLPPLESLTGEAYALGDLGKEEKATLQLITEAGLTS